MMRLLLDTNVLMKICHPKEFEGVKEWLSAWLRYAIANDDVEVVVSAVADYELRRGCLWRLDDHPNEPKKLARLDALCRLLGVHAVSNSHFKAAASHWADARRGGYSTAPEDRVDWDVIIASQAEEINAVVVTSNANHLRRYGVQADDWNDLPAPSTD